MSQSPENFNVLNNSLTLTIFRQSSSKKLLKTAGTIFPPTSKKCIKKSASKTPCSCFEKGIPLEVWPSESTPPSLRVRDVRAPEDYIPPTPNRSNTSSPGGWGEPQGTTERGVFTAPVWPSYAQWLAATFSASVSSINFGDPALVRAFLYRNGENHGRHNLVDTPLLFPLRNCDNLSQQQG